MKNGYILLVEDNPDDEVLTLRAFQKNNILNTVVVARDGQEALDYLFGEGEFSHSPENRLPAIVLLDLNLPKIGGLEILKSIRGNSKTKHLPVVILTTSREEEDILNSYELGANSYVRKPVDFNQFIEAVGKLGIYWLLINEVVEG